MTALLVFGTLIFAVIVGAAIQTFEGSGKYIMSDFEDHAVAQQRAIQRARENAQDKAGVYLTSFSRSVNAHIVADEISAVTNNIIEIFDVDVQAEPFEVKGEPGIIYTVTLKANIDTDGIFDFIRRDDSNKINIVRQNDELRDALRKNDEQVEDLKEQYSRATSQAEKNRIRKQMNDADRDFLANQKFHEAQRLEYAKDDNGAIKLYGEVLQIKPNYAEAYNNRGVIYAQTERYEQAIQDYTKAIELDPKNDFAYTNRANAYAQTERYEQAIRDYGKALQIKPYNAMTYKNRGQTYNILDKYKLAIRDFNKALEIHPYLTEVYAQRGAAYALTGNFKRAIDDFSEYIKLNPNDADAYNARGLCFAKLGETEKAQADFDKASQLGHVD